VRRPPSTRENETLDLLRKRVDPTGIRLERMRMEEGWLKNMAYFSGQQCFYIGDGRIWDATGDIPEHKVIYQVNLTRSAVLRAAAKVVGVHARFKAAPKTSSLRHLNIAETSEKVFDHILQANEWDYGTHLLGTMWAAICGSAFYKIVFDPQAGEPGRFYLDSKQTKNVVPEALLSDVDLREKERDGLFQDFAQGDVAISVENPYSVYHDWTSRDKSIKGCQWIAFRHYLDREVLADRYGLDVNDIQAAQPTAGLLNYEEAIAFMGQTIGGSPLSWSTPEDKRGERALQVEMWQRPNSAYPKGRRVVQVGDRIVVDGDNPHVGDRSAASHLPVVKQDWTRHPGRFWGSSLVEDLTSPQAHLNESRGCVLEFQRIFGRPATFVWSDSGLDAKNQTIDPGGVYTLSAHSKPPVHSPTPQLPTDVTNIGMICQQDLLSIASQSEIDGTKLPGQMRSGAAIQQMSQQREIALSLTQMEAVRSARDVGRASLALAQLFYTERRTIRFMGLDNQFEFLDFSGADLTNDIVVIGDPSSLETSAGRKQEMLDAIQAGAVDPVNNPEDKELFLASMHWNTGDILVNSKLKARKNQTYEIQEMIRNTAKYVPGGYPVAEYEDHALEYAVVRDFMYSQEFRTLDVATKSVIAAHAAEHKKAMMQEQLKVLQMQAMAAGTPGSKGKASQPAS
jgi:hypothetical protein